jgi:hypothetical protein
MQYIRPFQTPKSINAPGCSIMRNCSIGWCYVGAVSFVLVGVSLLRVAEVGIFAKERER